MLLGRASCHGRWEGQPEEEGLQTGIPRHNDRDDIVDDDGCLMHCEESCNCLGSRLAGRPTSASMCTTFRASNSSVQTASTLCTGSSLARRNAGPRASSFPMFAILAPGNVERSVALARPPLYQLDLCIPGILFVRARMRNWYCS